MKIMVTGATGFIGKELVKRLNDKGHEMVVLTRKPEAARFNIPVECELREWEPEGKALSPSIMKGIDAVINLAGEGIANGLWTDTRKQKIMNSRVSSVRRLVDAMVQCNKRPRVFVSASAIGFYGDRGDESLDETAREGEGFLSRVCQRWENEIFETKDSGIRTVALRFGMVLGHDGGALGAMEPAFRLGLAGRLGDGRQWMSWIHIHDLVDLLIHAVEQPGMNGIYNAVSPNPVRNLEFTKTLGQTLKRPTILPVPAFALRLLLGELSGLLLASQRVSADKIVKTGFNFNFANLKDALEDICKQSFHEIQTEQWVPQPIHKVFEFFRDARNLEKITPGDMRFRVVDQSTREIEEGTRINYRFSFHGIPMRWQSKIVYWKPDEKFSDLQMKGPYQYWRHTHEFTEKNNGTLIRDRVHYKIPLSFAIDWAAKGWIRRNLETVFNYRRHTLARLLDG
ncbi:MAG: TIGR01777 family protein [Candidatus Nitrohelix vancouverensis]|uniref:TIGR01777 family protein n=1 Tax=Candidatus Nitrohelix vancouverensis TaxID=2705534 RepID=A0A7T0C1A7_9BACT|nr:MAG: TIGR01777 family protein [Candidatus Nitrohelix vancouverensis]